MRHYLQNGIVNVNYAHNFLMVSGSGKLGLISSVYPKVGLQFIMGLWCTQVCDNSSSKISHLQFKLVFMFYRLSDGLSTNFVEIHIFGLVNWPWLILNTLTLFLLIVNKTHICIAPKNSLWLLGYKKLAINSPHITITSCTHIDSMVPMLTSVKKWQFWHEQTKSAERSND